MTFAIVFITFAIIYSAQASGICNDTQTSCETNIVGEHGCCPKPNAVCCSDGLHCCPQNAICNLEEGTCDFENSLNHPLLIKDPPAEMTRAAVAQFAYKLDRNYCPGGQYYCNDGTTCCHTPRGQWTCCPYQSASCCPDGLHCCQHGQHCDSTSRYCNQGDSVYPALVKQPAFPVHQDASAENTIAELSQTAHKLDRNYCPGGQYYCNDGTTCCQTPAGEWRCCPYQSASCCHDGMHCCRQGQQCHGSGYCQHGDRLYEALVNKPAFPVNSNDLDAVRQDASAENTIVELTQTAHKLDRNYCPGRQYYCNDGTTCCQTPAGEWRCCPYQSASCCHDGMHCCQHGQQCHGSGYCQHGDRLYEALVNKPAFPVNSNDLDA